MTQVGQRANDAVVTPARVLASEANHQLFNNGLDRRSARIGTVFGAIELAGNEPAIPSQDGIRLRGTGHLLQSLPSEALSNLGQCAPLRIGESKSVRKVSSQNAVLGSAVLVLQ